MTSGSCLCGGIVFQIDSQLYDASLCHCSICRKASGTAFAAYAAVESDHFSWLQGEALLREYSVSKLLSKAFCGRCGSTLLTRHQSNPQEYYISLGCLDGDPAITLEYHQYVDSRAGWYKIHDDLPQFPAWPEECV